MSLKTIKLLVAIAAAIMCSNAVAQDCNSCAGGGYGGYSNYGSLGGAGIASDNCGRGITNGQAASLWAGYCTESCGYAGGYSGGGFGGGYDSCSGGGGGCRLGQKLRGLFGGGLCGKLSGGGGYTTSYGGAIGGDCFGYPSGGGSCGASYGGSSCGTSYGGGGGGCALFGRIGGGRALGGGGFLSRLLSGGCLCKRSQPAQSYAVNYVPVTFQASADQCGSSDGYFNEFVGPEYGTTGMQSAVSGCATGACGGSVMSGYQDAGYQSGGAMGYSEYSADPGQSYSGFDQGMSTQSFDTGQSLMAQPTPSGAQQVIGEAIGGEINNAIQSPIGGGSSLGSGSR